MRRAAAEAHAEADVEAAEGGAVQDDGLDSPATATAMVREEQRMQVDGEEEEEAAAEIAETEQEQAQPQPEEPEALQEEDKNADANAVGEEISAASPPRAVVAAPIGDDEELDELESTPAATPDRSPSRNGVIKAAQNPSIRRTRASDSFANANGDLETPETSEDDEAEVQLSLQAHAAPASPGRRETPMRPRLRFVEPEEAQLPPSAQKPAARTTTVVQEEQEEAQLEQAANTRLPSSSPEPDLPTIGGSRKHRAGDSDSSEDSSSSSSDSDEDDDDDSSSGEDSPGGFLTGAARRLQAATGGRQSLGMVARDAFGKTRRPSLARKKPSALSASGSYNPSPLKNSAVTPAAAASSSSPVKGGPETADEVDEIDQLLSQTQQSQRAARRTSGVNWAQLEQEEEERQKRKGKGRASESVVSSEDENDQFEEAREQLDDVSVAQVVPADNDVDMALADENAVEQEQSTINGATAQAGEPVTGTSVSAAPRTTVDGDSAPITTALRESEDEEPVGDAPASQPEAVTGLAALEPVLPTQEASQFPNGARLYPDLSTIGNLASSSQPSSPPIEVDPSRVITDDEQTQELVTTPRAVEETLPAESQFVPLHKDKPLFLETQTQFETAQDLQDDVEPDTQLDSAQVDEDVDDDVEMQVTEAIVQEGPKETIQAPLTPDASAPPSPTVNAPAIVEPASSRQDNEDPAEADAAGPALSTPQAKSPAARQQKTQLLAPPTTSGTSTPARMTRAASARMASRSPSAEPPSAHQNGDNNGFSASQPVSTTTTTAAGTPISALARRKQAAAVAMAGAPLPTPSLANGLTPPAPGPSLSLPTARSRASGLPSLSQLDTVKRVTRRSARVSSASGAAGAGGAGAQRATSSQPAAAASFLARESDDDQDSSDDDEDADVGNNKTNGRLSMSQPVGRTRPRRGRESDLWK